MPHGTNSAQLRGAELAERTLHRRAVEAVIWGMPMVAVDAMRQSFFRDGGAKYGDVLYFGTPADQKFQFTTPNASTHYVYFNYNLKDGPIVMEIPAPVDAGLVGWLNDSWQAALVDIGPEGEDKGKGGRYLLIPPGYAEPVPAGFFAVPSNTVNGYALFRSVPAGSSAEDHAAAIALIKQIRLYPLAQADNPPEQTYIDVSGKVMDGVVPLDDRYFDSLARMVDEEPICPRDMVAMAQLRSLGIVKGESFAPSAGQRAVLKDAAAEAHAWFMDAYANGIAPFFPSKQWGSFSTNGMKTGFTFELPDFLDIDQRGALNFIGFNFPKRANAATIYLSGTKDSAREPLTGEHSYRLHVPANVPVKQYWSVTVYDLTRGTFIRNSPRVTLDSFDAKVPANPDGSKDVYFGPQAPAGKEASWVPTEPGQPWFAVFRFYGPEQALLDRAWVLPDLEKIG